MVNATQTAAAARAWAAEEERLMADPLAEIADCWASLSSRPTPSPADIEFLIASLQCTADGIRHRLEAARRMAAQPGLSDEAQAVLAMDITVQERVDALVDAALNAQERHDPDHSPHLRA